jgi:uncharacterized protein YecE (DUF72 family)
VTGKVWLGCSGWAYPSWRPGFYPEKTPLKRLLEAYSARLNSVEVNYTFRALPSSAVVEGWLRATPEHFRFSLKAPQRLTHFQKLRGSGAVLGALLAAAEPLRAAGRLGAVLLQLPPTFRCDKDVLRLCLQEAEPLALRLAFEFRHASWFDDDVYALLREHRAALCVAESDDLVTPEVRTAPFAAYRLRRSAYSEAELAKTAERLTAAALAGDVFAYFKHEEQPDGPLRAAAVRGLLGQ